MATGRGLLYVDADGGSGFNCTLFQNQRLLSPFFASGSMVSFRAVNGGKKSDRSFFQSFDQEEDETDHGLEDYLTQPEKKRRLTLDQAQFLEKTFEVENKLEPDRKVQLANDLGLQPRQIAIWFQNRRARWKTKQLERDYEALRNKYDNLKAGYSNLLKEKEDLRAEVIQLTNKLLLKDKEKGELAASDLKKLSDVSPKGNMVDPILEDELSKVSAMALKQQEDLNTSKSVVFDSESPHYPDGGQSNILEQGNSSYVFEPDQSNLSQDEEENFNKNLFAKVGHDHCPMTSPNLSCFGFPVDDQGFGFWPY